MTRNDKPDTMSRKSSARGNSSEFSGSQLRIVDAISKIKHWFGKCESYCLHCYDKLNSVVHIHNWDDKTAITEDRSCGCEDGTYCGDEIVITDSESYCGEYIGEYSDLVSWTWQHWVDEEHFDEPYCKKCYKLWKLDPSNFEKEKIKL